MSAADRSQQDLVDHLLAQNERLCAILTKLISEGPGYDACADYRRVAASYRAVVLLLRDWLGNAEDCAAFCATQTSPEAACTCETRPMNGLRRAIHAVLTDDRETRSTGHGT